MNEAKRRKGKMILLAPLALLFLSFGIFMLWTAYYQENPIVFLALFFSSSLIVLLSATCLIGLVWRILRPLENEEDEPRVTKDAPPP